MRVRELTWISSSSSEAALGTLAEPRTSVPPTVAVQLMVSSRSKPCLFFPLTIHALAWPCGHHRAQPLCQRRHLVVVSEAWQGQGCMRTGPCLAAGGQADMTVPCCSPQCRPASYTRDSPVLRMKASINTHLCFCHVREHYLGPPAAEAFPLDQLFRLPLRPAAEVPLLKCACWTCGEGASHDLSAYVNKVCLRVHALQFAFLQAPSGCWMSAASMCPSVLLQYCQGFASR